MSNNLIVAPFAGVWIEIFIFVITLGQLIVAPFAGVWIEIISGTIVFSKIGSRTLRGCVD